MNKDQQEKIVDMLAELRYVGKNVKIDRTSWTELMMDIAKGVATRSHDSQTQCGSVICNRDNEIISTGYNGFIRNIDDTILPNTRPQKYDFMIHAEVNSILNSARQGKSTKCAIIYVTGMPCLRCLQYIWQAGIVKVIYGNQQTNMQQSEEFKLKTNLILALTDLEMEFYNP